MRASRLLSILILLQMRGRLDATQLAREFEVSVRTIYRDMDQLSASGVPIYAEPGRGGGFALLDGYRTKLTGFTAAEAGILPLSGLPSAASDLGFAAELSIAQLKLLASLPPDAGANAQKVAACFHLDPGGWYARPVAPDLLPGLAAAVWASRRIHVRYESWQKTVERDLQPLGLVLKAGTWYLVAAAGRTPRTYRVSSILRLEVRDETFVRPQKFDLARFWIQWARDFETRLLRDRAVVEVSPEGRELLRDWAPALAGAVAAGSESCEPQGWVRAEIPIEDVSFSALQLLRMGAEIKVISPRGLVDRIASEARRIAAYYPT